MLKRKLTLRLLIEKGHHIPPGQFSLTVKMREKLTALQRSLRKPSQINTGNCKKKKSDMNRGIQSLFTTKPQRISGPHISYHFIIAFKSVRQGERFVSPITCAWQALYKPLQQPEWFIWMQKTRKHQPLNHHSEDK